MLDIAFVILNYNVFRETVECVSSIENNIDTKNYKILIVDNASERGIGAKLHDHYDGNSHVNVIINDKNEGFARGNNIGINYFRNKAEAPKYICCLNNDTLLEQKNIYKVVDSVYINDNSIAAIGPRIYDSFYIEHAGMNDLNTIEDYKKLMLETMHSRKEPRYITSKVQWKRKLLNNRFIYDINHNRRMFEKKIRQVLLKSRKRRRYEANIVESENKTDIIGGTYDLILHGCCLFFTPSFFHVLKGFDPSTFLYGEEAILFLDIIKHGMRTIKSDNLHIRHLEDVSTDASVKKKEKRDFQLKHEIESMQVLINKMKQYELIS